MTSPRVHPSRQCEGKIKHPDRRAARIARKRVGRRDADGHLTIYVCPWCRAFHIGHAWSDPYFVELAEREARREFELEQLDDVVAAVTARLLGITVADALELLNPSPLDPHDEYEEDTHG